MGLSKLSRAMRRGGGRKRQKRDGKEIPFDLVIEILARLPAKSLMRFKCVSKLWFSLIISRYFSNRYLTVASAPLRIYVSFVHHYHHRNSMEPRSLLLSLSSSSATSFNPDLTMPGMGGHNLEVLRGLILYSFRRKARVYNPATRQLVTLPLPPTNMEEIGKHVFYFLGHDPVLDQYKVVCNVVVFLSEDPQRFTSEYWVFVLETGGSWKRIAFDQPHCPTRIGPCINGVVYYLAINCISRHPTKKKNCISRHMVFTFDSRSEEFNMIESPHTKFGKSVGFFEYGGKPAIFHHAHLQQKGFVDLWVLEDGGKWSNQSLVLQPCQMHFVNTGTVLSMIGATQDGEVMLVPKPMFPRSYLLCYDLQKNDLRKVNMRGIWDQGFNKSNLCIQSMDKSESIMHLEI